jgi:hypothetical protein
LHVVVSYAPRAGHRQSQIPSVTRQPEAHTCLIFAAFPLQRLQCVFAVDDTIQQLELLWLRTALDPACCLQAQQVWHTAVGSKSLLWCLFVEPAMLVKTVLHDSLVAA